MLIGTNGGYFPAICRVCFFYSCEAILRCSWFLQFKEFELFWGAVFFTTRRGVLEKSFFLINFIGVIFEAGNETREKILALNKSEERSEKRVVFVHTAVFERARN